MVLLVSLVAASCTKEDECSSGALEIITLQDLGCDIPPHQISINSSNEFELIRDQEQYENLLTTSCRPTIDWDKYDMIAGSIFLQYGLNALEQGAYFNCFENKLAITITAHLNESTVALPVGFAFLIPKLDDTETPYVSIVTQQ